MFKNVIACGGRGKKTAHDSAFSVTMLAKHHAYAFLKVGAPTSHKQNSIKTVVNKQLHIVIAMAPLLTIVLGFLLLLQEAYSGPCKY